MAHKDIRIQFEVKGRRYEAVGFLNEDESSIEGLAVFQRIDGEHGGAIKYKDREFIRQGFGQLPAELNEFVLVTDDRDMDDPRDVFCFRWEGNWGGCYKYVGDQWGANYLVVRSLP